ncbi:MAG: Holliday junction branch migration protein RuvA [Candidatus Omnitrophica bacterium]|nr:Holliday junction branch migration protein RuvA [Candidatus Omnitrophota bacterium]
MITQVKGTVEQWGENAVVVDVHGLCYEVHVPTAIMKSFDGGLAKGSAISLVTYHYHQADPSKSIPVLIGFANRIEKEFFERFITVSGVGPKAAVKALSMPIPEIAQAIDAGDLGYLKSLPGIGGQRAKEIIAKLQGKMGKFALMQRGACEEKKVTAAIDIREEALEVLLQLQYKKEEARAMIQKAFSRRPDMASAEELLNEVYRQRKDLPAGRQGAAS